MSLPPDHPIHAHLPDTEALLSLLLADYDSAQLALASDSPTSHSLRKLVASFKKLAEDLDINMPEDEPMDVISDPTSPIHDHNHSHSLPSAPSPSHSLSSSDPTPSAPTSSPTVLIIGAGPAGLGAAIPLLLADPSLDLLILDRGPAPGATFTKAWHPHTTFISPSFYSNNFNQPDLNALSPLSKDVGPSGLNPAVNLYPSGQQYHEYLDYIATTMPLALDDVCLSPTATAPTSPPHTLSSHIHYNTTVTSISSIRGLYVVETEGCDTPILAKYLIMATGLSPPPEVSGDGALHYAHVDTTSPDFFEAGCLTIVGCGESCVDLLRRLAQVKRRAPLTVTVVRRSGRGEGGGGGAEDPSMTLAPKSRAFLEGLIEGGGELTVEYVDNYSYTHASRNSSSSYVAVLSHTGSSSTLTTPPSSHPIILCTGFSPSETTTDLIPFDDGIYPNLNPACDESLTTANCFLVGPAIRYRGSTVGCTNDVLLCYVYKFRCRFGIVAAEIVSRIIEEEYVDENGALEGAGEALLERLGRVETLYREKGMWVEDLSKAKCGEIENKRDGSC